MKNYKIKVGIILVIISLVVYAFLLVIPFLPVENSFKIAVGAVCMVLGEILFWFGGFLIGKELFKKYKSKLNPKNWFKKRTDIN